MAIFSSGRLSNIFIDIDAERDLIMVYSLYSIVHVVEARGHVIALDTCQMRESHAESVRVGMPACLPGQPNQRKIQRCFVGFGRTPLAPKTTHSVCLSGLL